VCEIIRSFLARVWKKQMMTKMGMNLNTVMIFPNSESLLRKMIVSSILSPKHSFT